jgi:ABC-2 type transport system ATP-binding protein
VRDAVKNLPGVTKICYTPNESEGLADVVIETDSAKDISEEVFFAFSGMNKPILRMTSAKVSLEDVFIELTSDKDQEENTQASAGSEREEAAQE